MPENNEIRTPREGAGTAPEETNAGAAAAWPDISGVSYHARGASRR